MQTARATGQLCMKTLVLWDREFRNGAFPFLAVKHCDTPKKHFVEIIKDKVGTI
jgi:hypothetical protein